MPMKLIRRHMRHMSISVFNLIGGQSMKKVFGIGWADARLFGPISIEDSEARTPAHKPLVTNCTSERPACGVCNASKERTNSTLPSFEPCNNGIRT